MKLGPPPLFEPVEQPRGRINLVVVWAVGEDRFLLQVLGEPWSALGHADGTVLDHCGLREHPHDLVGLRLIAGDRVEALADQLLNQLGARGLILDQHDIGADSLVLLAHGALQFVYSMRRRNTSSR